MKFAHFALLTHVLVNAREKAKLKAQELTQERETVEQEKQELQEKYAEKCR